MSIESNDQKTAPVKPDIISKVPETPQEGDIQGGVMVMFAICGILMLGLFLADMAHRDDPEWNKYKVLSPETNKNTGVIPFAGYWSWNEKGFGRHTE